MTHAASPDPDGTCLGDNPAEMNVAITEAVNIATAKTARFEEGGPHWEKRRILSFALHSSPFMLDAVNRDSCSREHKVTEGGESIYSTLLLKILGLLAFDLSPFPYENSGEFWGGNRLPPEERRGKGREGNCDTRAGIGGVGSACDG